MNVQSVGPAATNQPGVAGDGNKYKVCLYHNVVFVLTFHGKSNYFFH